ncbi:MAG TPA: arylamine N-acetyltransferase [Chryseolinea sp.]
MDVQLYLKRIDFVNKVTLDLDTLTALHKNHVFHVPFENLDIYYKSLFDLEIANIYQKVVVRNRGGFCYELNSLFNELLLDLGFKSCLISSRIFNDNGSRGPEYDHMSISVDIAGRNYLCDVGFGDLFISPIEIREGIQHDGKNFFKIKKFSTDEFTLSMASGEDAFQKKYTFIPLAVPINAFHESCYDKQTNPTSYFVKNIVCTKPTPTGRRTVFNSKLVETTNGSKTETLINNDDELLKVLEAKFALKTK